MALANIADFREVGGIAVAFALGLLVGLQRGWAQRNAAPGSRFAGIRTFGLFGLAGGVAGAVTATDRTIAAIVMAAVAGLVLVSYYRVTRRDGSISGTASLAGLITLACGFLAGTGERMTATVVAVSMVLLLAMRTQLHRLVGRISEAEVLAVARFAVIAMVVLPLLPDHDYGPLQAWNPRQLWFVVVLVSGFSLTGYIAAKLLGPSRGTIATAAAGAVVSSTAVTAALAARLKDPGEDPAVLHCAMSAASVVMFARVLVLTGVLAPFALPWLTRLALPGMLVSLAGAAWFLSRPGRPDAARAKAVAVRNPFSIGPALILAALVMVTTLAARWVLSRYGDGGLAVVLAISGTVDVDSAIIALGSLPPGALEPALAGLVLLPPILLNTLVKAGVAIGIAGWRRGLPGALALVLSALASLAALPFILR